MRRDDDSSFETRIRVRDAYREFLDRIDVNYFITFSFGYRIETIAAQKSIKKFCNMVDRKALGNNWNTKPEDDRIKLVAFGEHMGTNPHWHAPAELPKASLRVLERNGDQLWLKIQPRGELWLEVPNDDQDVIDYCTKRLLEIDAADRVCPYFPVHRDS